MRCSRAWACSDAAGRAGAHLLARHAAAARRGARARPQAAAAARRRAVHRPRPRRRGAARPSCSPRSARAAASWSSSRTTSTRWRRSSIAWSCCARGRIAHDAPAPAARSTARAGRRLPRGASGSASPPLAYNRDHARHRPPPVEGRASSSCAPRSWSTPRSSSPRWCCSSSASPSSAGRSPTVDVAAGVLWVAIALAGTVGISRAFEREREGDTMRALLLAPVPRSALYLSKLMRDLAAHADRRGGGGAACCRCSSASRSARACRR